MREIYLDNNSTTSVALEVVRDITECLGSVFYNPSSLHKGGQKASRIVSQSRAELASYLGCHGEEILFTASGSEANSLAILGFCRANPSKGKHLVTSEIEHPSVIKTMQHLGSHGYEVTFLSVDNDGFVSPDSLRDSIRPDTVLVSIMAANNEIGTIQSIKEMAEICREKSVTFHSDLVQAFGKIPLNMSDLSISLGSISGHKIHGPKGIGVLYRRKGVALYPFICGGGQEFGLRAGTENTAFIKGLATAVSLCSDADIRYMKNLQKYLLGRLSCIKGIRINGPIDLKHRVCSNINFSVEHRDGERLLKLFSNKGLFVSTGSACSSKSARVSPVLTAISCPPNYIHGSLRIGISRYTTRDELDSFIVELESILKVKCLAEDVDSQLGAMSHGS